MIDAKCWSCEHEFEFWSAEIRDAAVERVYCPKCRAINFRVYAAARLQAGVEFVPVARRRAK